MILGMRKKIAIFYLVIIVVAACVLIFFKVASSQNYLIFGGKVTGTPFFCNCSGNFLVTISPPVPGTFVYYMGSQAFLNYNLPQPGIWALGTYTPVGVCLIYSGKGCVNAPTPVMGTISPMVGTSIAF